MNVAKSSSWRGRKNALNKIKTLVVLPFTKITYLKKKNKIDLFFTFSWRKICYYHKITSSHFFSLLLLFWCDRNLFTWVKPTTTAALRCQILARLWLFQKSTCHGHTSPPFPSPSCSWLLSLHGFSFDSFTQHHALPFFPIIFSWQPRGRTVPWGSECAGRAQI